jgi:hypothetical protein
MPSHFFSFVIHGRNNVVATWTLRPQCIGMGAYSPTDVLYAINHAKQAGDEGVYTNSSNSLGKAANPTNETVRVLLTLGDAHKWVENTPRRIQHSSQINLPQHSGLYTRPA